MRAVCILAGLVAWQPGTAAAVCIAPPCHLICETAPMSAYYRAEVASETSVRLLERLGGNDSVAPAVGLVLDAAIPPVGGPLAEGSPLLVSVTSAHDTFDVFDVVAIREHYPSGETVCDGLSIDEYMDIAADDRCREIAIDHGFILTECNDVRGGNRGCATTSNAALLISLAVLLVARRRPGRHT